MTGVWDSLLELEHTVYWPEAADCCTELVSFVWPQQVPASQKPYYYVLLDYGSARNVKVAWILLLFLSFSSTTEIILFPSRGGSVGLHQSF